MFKQFKSWHSNVDSEKVMANIDKSANQRPAISQSGLLSLASARLLNSAQTPASVNTLMVQKTKRKIPMSPYSARNYKCCFL